jgi:hypothetical protein
VLLVTEHAHHVLLLGDVGHADRTTETLILLRIVVLETDLEFDGLDEAALRFSRILQDLLAGFEDLIALCRWKKETKAKTK